MKPLTYIIRKVKSVLPRKEIESSMLEEICKVANPKFSFYRNFMLKHSVNDHHVSHCKNLYVEYSSESCQKIKDYLAEHESKKIAKLFEDAFLPRFKNANLLITKHRLENNIIFDNFGITVQDLDIAGEISLEFNQFLQVSFTRNIFRGNIAIKITNPYSAIGEFTGNQARKNIEITFYNVPRITFDKNKYMAEATFICGRANTFGLERDTASLKSTTIDFISNKIFNLNIYDHRDTAAWHGKSFPIEHIAFLEGNNIEKCNIRTSSNKISYLFPGEPAADIESIFFDTNENIGLSHGQGSRFFRAAEIFFRELKKQAVEKEDRLLENTYKRQEKIFFRARLYRLEDRLILWWGNFASDTGTSWKKPLGLLFLAQFLLALTAHCLFAGYDPSLDKMCTPDLKECNPYLDTGFTPFFGLLAWFMNPVSLLPSAKITMASWFIYVLFFCQKLFSAVFYYEIVTVLRRFSK